MNLVTGSTGLLGTHVMLELLKRGQKVRALVRPDSNKDIVRQVFEFYQPGTDYFSKIEWVEGDILDVISLQDAMEGCDVIYHTAAMVSYHKADKGEMFRINVNGTANVVNAALEMGIVQFCHASSISSLGKAVQGELLNEDSMWRPSDDNSNYSASKYLSEMEVWRGIQEGLHAVIVNPAVIIGPGDFSRSSGNMFTKLSEGLNYYPQGGTGFVSASDCAKAMVDLVEKKISGERFLLVSENMSMKSAFELIADSLSQKKPQRVASDFILQSARIAEWLKEKFTGKKALITRETIRNTSLQVLYSNEKICSALGMQFQPVETAIQETGAFFKKQKA